MEETVRSFGSIIEYLPTLYVGKYEFKGLQFLLKACQGSVGILTCVIKKYNNVSADLVNRTRLRKLTS